MPAPTPDSPWRTDIARTLARQGELQRSAGDALVLAADSEGALDAYRAQSEEVTGPRILLAFVRTGRPASAAYEVVRRVRAERSPPTRGEIAALQSVSRSRPLASTVAAALLELRADFEPGSPTLRAELARAAASALGGEPGAEFLRAHLVVDSPSAAAATDLLERAPNVRARIGEAITLTRARPEHARRWGAALLAGDARPIDITAALDGVGGWEGALLGAGVDLQLRLPRRALDRLVSINDLNAPRNVVDMLLVEAGADAGRWDVVDDAMKRLTSSPDVDPVLLLGALRAAQRLDEAYEIAERVMTERDPEVESLLAASELAMQRGEPRDAELFLQTASELDPFEERVYAAQLALYSPDGPLADESQETRVRRALRERLPEGVLVGLYDARDLAEGGVLDEAERRLRDLVERDTDEPSAYELLLSVWGQMAGSGASGTEHAYEDAAAWLAERLHARPGSPPIGAALARVLITLGRTDEAIATLEGVDEAVGSPVLSAMREQIIARELKDPDRARAMALARLDHPTLSIDDALTRAMLEVEGGSSKTAVETLRANLPESVTLTPEQGQRLARVGALSIATLRPGTWKEGDYEALAAPAVALVDMAAARGVPLGQAIQDARMSLAALNPKATTEQLAALALRDETGDDAQTTATFKRLAEGLIANGRASEAVALSITGALRGEKLDTDLLSYAIMIAAQFGDAQTTRVLIDRLESSGRSVEAAPVAWDDAPPPGVSASGVHAQLAYQVASLASFLDRDEVAESVYRVALEQDPTHTWSNNDLGYMLADEGRELDEAERLIEVAYGQDQTSSNIVDSLGWVRYKRGEFEDVGGREGAVTLLKRALSLEEGDSNATLHDHLGDALWRTGQREAAEQAWLDAEEIGGNQIRTVRRQGIDSPAARRFEARRRIVRAKLLAVQAGEDPPVAPIVEPPPDE
ncbi:MAG: tetratricopeptide repeat protein [Phycisphaerales bacterium]